MKCPNCYTELPDTAKMCYICKQQIINDDSEGDTSKICPNCGIALPLTATMCYCCKYVFNGSGPLIENNYSRINYPNQRYPSQRRGNNDSESLRRTAMIICIIGSILCGIAVFMPYLGISILGTTSSARMIDNVGIGIETLFWASASIIFCSPDRQKNGTGHIILGVISVGNCIYNASRLPSFLNEKGYKYSNLVQLQSGFYVLFLGSIMVLASGIVMRVASKRE